MRRLVIVAALAGIWGILEAPGAAGAQGCADQVLADWFDNGRVDRVYQLRCYEDTVATLPPDLRDYTDAEDVIRRALQRAARRQPASAAAAAPADEPSTSTLALVGAGAAMAVVLAAAAGLEWRRRSTRSS